METIIIETPQVVTRVLSSGVGEHPQIAVLPLDCEAYRTRHRH